MQEQPKVIFLDAVGTLFGVKGSVGEAYCKIARQFGVNADSGQVNQAFFQCFGQASPMVFPEAEPEEIPQREYGWWESIAQQTFQQVGVFDRFSQFSEFFAALYDYFSTADPWFLYADTLKALQYWQQEGIELGVVSNFDSRIHLVLAALGLDSFFTSVTISTEVGAAKPNPKMFQTALQKHNCPVQLAWHIGDSFREDYEGAKAAGLRAIWLKRP